MVTTNVPPPPTAPIGDAEHVVPLPNGRTLTVRPATPDDVEGVLSLYAALPAQDRRLRFFGTVRVVRPIIERLIGAAERGGLWLVAVTDDGEIVADGGYDLLPDGDAEFALTVARAWRGWLGPYLLQLLAEDASRRGIRNLRASILSENRVMRALVQHRGYASVDDTDFTVQEVTISAGGGRPSWPPRHERPRLLVEGCGGRWRGGRGARDSGWDVITCAGPGSRSVPTCPLLEGETCPLVEGADLVVLALPPGDPRCDALLEAHQQRSDRPPLLAAELSNEDLSGRLRTEREAIGSLPPSPPGDLTGDDDAGA
jgi:hypothetical protein